MNFKFNVISLKSKGKLNSIYFSIHLLGINQTPLSEKLLNSRNSFTIEHRKSLFQGNRRMCDLWLNDFHQKSISEQLDFLEGTFSKRTSTIQEANGPHFLKQKSNTEFSQWRITLRKLFKEALDTKKLTNRLHKKYLEIISLEDKLGRINPTIGLKRLIIF